MNNRSTTDALADAAVSVVNRNNRRRCAAAASRDDWLPENAAREKEAQADAFIATHDLDSALECLAKAIFLQPSRSELYAKRAHVFCELGDVKSAMASYRKLFAIDTNPPQRIKDAFAALLHLHGYSLLRLGDTPAVAIAYLSEAIHLNGLEESYWLHRALAHVHAGALEHALADVDHCICLNAHDVEYFVLRAKLHWRLHQHDRASSDIARAAALAPDHPEVVAHAERLRNESQTIYDQARRHVLVRDFAAAIACLNNAAAIAPDDTRFYVLRAAAHCELGALHVALQDAEKAMTLHRRRIAEQTKAASQGETSIPTTTATTTVAVDRSPVYREIATLRNRILADLALAFLKDKAFQLALNAFNQAMRGEAELATRFHEPCENVEHFVHRGDAYRGLGNLQAVRWLLCGIAIIISLLAYGMMWFLEALTPLELHRRSPTTITHSRCSQRAPRSAHASPWCTTTLASSSSTRRSLSKQRSSSATRSRRTRLSPCTLCVEATLRGTSTSTTLRVPTTSVHWRSTQATKRPRCECVPRASSVRFVFAVLRLTVLSDSLHRVEQAGPVRGQATGDWDAIAPFPGR